MAAHHWDPDRYLAYADERGRPFVDLLARVGATAPTDVVDLGCGPGTLTRLLAERWPGARVRGLDASPEMVAAARRDVPEVDVEVADLRAWAASGEQADVVVSNATLQWLPDHLALMPALAEAVRPGGWLAFQVPGNFDQPSHTIRTELASRPPYDAHTRDVAVPASHDPEDYLAALVGCGLVADVWETTYLHVLTGEDPVFRWVSGTGARPTLQALPGDLRTGFEEEFRARLRAAYPDRGHGVVLPFRRVFAVGRRPGDRAEES
jgi:trans-aconitate 2-methyltransferase